MSNKNSENVSLHEHLITEEEIGAVNGGVNPRIKYACINPNCPEYLVYVPYQPAGNKCDICGGEMTIIS